ncbi:hypothetical protein EXIGLDRAFT_724827, partial [Exidia glandulosa HHB12029]
LVKMKTYAPYLAGFIRRMRLRQLQDVTLAHVLAGDTCTPISLPEFEAYLAYTENALQKLQFVVWFQDYTKRFFAFPPHVRCLAPGPPDEVFERARNLRPIFIHRESNTSDEEGIALCPQDPTIEAEKNRILRQIVPADEADVEHTRSSTDLGDIGDRDSWASARTLVQPCRDECLHIAETFFRVGSSKELKVDAAARNAVFLRLRRTTHPDVFLSVYEQIYHQLESQSLPNFIVLASTNVNVQKQMLWFTTGAISIAIALSIFISMVVALPDRHPSARAWRTFAVPFIWIGLSQLYNAVNGLCRQIYQRGGAQLRVWELQDASYRILKPSTSRLPSSLPPTPPARDKLPTGFANASVHAITLPSSESEEKWDSGSENEDTSESEKYESPGPVDSPMPLLKSFTRRFSLVPPTATQDRNGFMRPAIFGPEKIVQDKRIRAVHTRIVRGLLFFVVGGTLILCIPLYAIPGRKH